MPVVDIQDIALPGADVIRRQGIPGFEKARPEVVAVITEMVDAVCRENMLKGRISYEIYKVKSAATDSAVLDNGSMLKGKAFKLLESAGELAVAVCTIGDGLEKTVADYFGRKDMLRGMILDGIGSAAVDSVSQEACRLISERAAASGKQAGSPIGPGMPGFPITEQGALCELAGADKIGVRLLSSGMLVPRKSVSMAIGIGSGMKTWTQEQVCAHCPTNRTCTHRVK